MRNRLARKIGFMDPFDIEALRTQGIRKNAGKNFGVTFPGKELYQLIEMCRFQAEQSSHYIQIRSWVYFAEKLYQQGRGQGF